MNEQIKELFKQTALHRNDHTTEQRLYEVEKFAELIVKECAKIVEDNIDPQNAWMTPGDLLKHFGVKE